MAHRSLEKHPWFSYIAWGSVIGFALFVGNLTLHISQEIAAIEAQTQTLQSGF